MIADVRGRRRRIARRSACGGRCRSAGAFARSLGGRCVKDERCSGHSRSTARRCGRSPKSRSRCCRTSRPRRSSRWTMRGSSTKSGSVRRNCGSPSTTWATASRCSTPTLRLAAWNLNFQQMLDLPDGFLAERPTLCRVFPVSGGARRISRRHDVEAELRPPVEDTRARDCASSARGPTAGSSRCGAIAVPGGGFVLIYGDITERKRAEAEIRAARDAAETGAARAAGGAGQSDPGREDGLARAIDRRHRARDQEPAQFRQQLRRAVDRAARRAEGERRAGASPRSTRTPAPRSTRRSRC